MQVGLGVSSDTVQAVLVRRGRIMWSAARDIDTPESLEAEIDQLLRAIPRRRWRRLKAVAAIGPTFVQTKALTGLPQVTNADDLARMVSTNVHRFFLTNGVPTVTSCVRSSNNGRLWVAAFERPVIDAVIRACKGRRVKLEALVPTATVLGDALQGGSFTWRDGSTAFQLAIANKRLFGIRRIGSGTLNGSVPPKPVDRLAALGEDAWRWADAFGAAVADPNTALRVTPKNVTNRAQSVPRWRSILAVAAVLLGAVVLIAAPGFGEYLAAMEAESWLAEHRAVGIEAMRAQSNLERVTSALNAITDFKRSRRSMVLFLRDLTRTVPNESALLALRVDTLEGTIVLLSPPGASSFEWLEQIPDVIEPTMVGPVTRERFGDRTLERMTVRFHFGKSDVPTSGQGTT